MKLGYQDILLKSRQSPPYLTYIDTVPKLYLNCTSKHAAWALTHFDGVPLSVRPAMLQDVPDLLQLQAAALPGIHVIVSETPLSDTRYNEVVYVLLAVWMSSPPPATVSPGTPTKKPEPWSS